MKWNGFCWIFWGLLGDLGGSGEYPFEARMHVQTSPRHSSPLLFFSEPNSDRRGESASWTRKTRIKNYHLPIKSAPEKWTRKWSRKSPYPPPPPLEKHQCSSHEFRKAFRVWSEFLFQNEVRKTATCQVNAIFSKLQSSQISCFYKKNTSIIVESPQIWSLKPRFCGGTADITFFVLTFPPAAFQILYKFHVFFSVRNTFRWVVGRRWCQVTPISF